MAKITVEHDTDHNTELFIGQARDEQRPFTYTVDALGRLLHSLAEDVAYGRGNYEGMRVWRWTGPGAVEELRFDAGERSPFDGDGYADQEWAVVGPDGTVYAKTGIRIDGHA